jgi:hypothetical protein
VSRGKNKRRKESVHIVSEVRLENVNRLARDRLEVVGRESKPTNATVAVKWGKKLETSKTRLRKRPREADDDVV